MGTRIEIGRIAGIAIFLDMFFVLVLLVSSSQYFTSGNTQVMSAGLVVIAGIFCSILLHELGHAAAARLFKTSVTHIDLTGLGGIAHFASSLPRARPPASIYRRPGGGYRPDLRNGRAGDVGPGQRQVDVAFALFQLSTINFYLAAFNLLPAFPLDGGHARRDPRKMLGGIWAQRIVSALGLAIAAWIAYLAVKSLPSGLFLLLVAFLILESNWTAFNQVGGFGGRR
jgi:Zn-dependent protease